jgi:hypothetical protein
MSTTTKCTVSSEVQPVFAEVKSETTTSVEAELRQEMLKPLIDAGIDPKRIQAVESLLSVPVPSL